MCSLKEVFELYKIEHPDEKVGRSKFCELRPKHILLSSKMPHNVCLCIYHKNFISVVNILHQYNDKIPVYSFPKELICKDSSQSFWLNECEASNYVQGFHK